MEDYLRIGVYSNTHGIRGEIKVYPTTDDLDRFKQVKKVYLDTPKEMMEVEIKNVRYFKNMVILKFKGIDNINDIEKYKGCDILMNREDAPALEEGEYYIYDLLQCEVVLEDGSHFGKMKEVLTTAANSVYVVATEDNKEVLLPSIPDCVKNVDIENKVITVHLMDGLL
ncbi:MAG: ribosome maturation factor RimM [Lachnospiraceae bacterium]|nr:ribosome maturation factor RimM [Lachnospiraceae bacterium]